MQGQDWAVPGRGAYSQNSVKHDHSPSSVKNVNLRPQANPGHRRRAWPRPQEAGANQAGKPRKGGMATPRILVKPFGFKPIK